MRIKAIDVDKDQQRHSTEILLAEYIGRDQNAKYPRQEWVVNTEDSYAYEGNRRRHEPTKTLDRNLTACIHRKK